MKNWEVLTLFLIIYCIILLGDNLFTILHFPFVISGFVLGAIVAITFLIRESQRYIIFFLIGMLACSFISYKIF